MESHVERYDTPLYMAFIIEVKLLYYNNPFGAWVEPRVISFTGTVIFWAG